jgi:hypothetical protein
MVFSIPDKANVVSISMKLIQSRDGSSRTVIPASHVDYLRLLGFEIPAILDVFIVAFNH